MITLQRISQLYHTNRMTPTLIYKTASQNFTQYYFKQSATTTPKKVPLQSFNTICTFLNSPFENQCHLRMEKGAEHLFYEKPSFLCSWKLCPEKEKKLFNYKLQIIILLPTGSSTLSLTLKTVSKNRQNDYTKQAPEFLSPCNYGGKMPHLPL